MKKTFAIIISVILVALTAVPAFAADYTCTLKPSATDVKAGNTVKVDVELSAGFSGIDLIISYDADSFEFIAEHTNDSLMVVSNPKKAGEIHIVAVSDEVQPAITIYSFELRALGGKGKVEASVREALADGENDISSLVKVEAFGIKVKGSAERINPITTAAATAENQSEPSTADSSDSAQGSQDAHYEQNSVIGNAEEQVSINDVTEIQGTVPATDADGNWVSDEEFKKESNKGLIIAAVIAVITLAAVIAIILKKRSDKNKESLAQAPEK